MLSDYGILHGVIPFFFLASSSRSKSSLHAAVTSSSLMDAGNVTKPTQEMSTTLSLGTTTFLAGALAGVALPSLLSATLDGGLIFKIANDNSRAIPSTSDTRDVTAQALNINS